MPDPIALVSISSPATRQTISLVSVYSPATCQTLSHEDQFTMLPLSLCQTFALISVYQPCHLPDFTALFSVYSRATCQTLFHWFQFTILPLFRPYGIGFSLQPCHWSDFVSLVSVCNPDACQTLFHGYSLQSCACQTLFDWFQLAVLSLARFDLSRFSLQPAYIRTALQLCHRTEYTSPGPRCDLIGQNLFH